MSRGSRAGRGRSLPDAGSGAGRGRSRAVVGRHPGLGRRAVLVTALLLAPAAGARGQGAAPPPEAADGDWEVERADSLEGGAVEVEVGASGREGRATRRTRRVRFQGEGLAGSVREGDGDPLAGTLFDAAAAGGRLGVGTFAPRWGAGLLLGAPAEPWSFAADDRGSGALRGRSGEGLRFERRGALAVEALGGRFRDRALGGARLGAGAGALGVIAGAGAAQSSLALLGHDALVEAALDRGGAWRAEARLRQLAAGGALALRARAGHDGFQSLAEPRRSGPARVLGAAFERGAGAARVLSHAALWRWRPGVDGARAGLEVRWRLAHHDALALGFEEQRGARRYPASALTLDRAGRPRQGLWGAWRGGAAGLRMELVHETWGGRFARRAVRTVSAARVETSPHPGWTLAVTHSAWRVHPGESLHLAESHGARLVLRALSGRGARTRVEAGLPAGGGRVRAALDLTAERLRPRPQWTLEWTRRARGGGERRARDRP